MKQKFTTRVVCGYPHGPWVVPTTAGPADKHDPPLGGIPLIVVSRVHHGRGNELFDPKFYAEGPRDAGAALNAPMKGTFLSSAAFLWHTKIL